MSSTPPVLEKGGGGACNMSSTRPVLEKGGGGRVTCRRLHQS